VRLVDDEGAKVAPGEVGELTCRGPYTLRGYYGVPSTTPGPSRATASICSGDLMCRHPSGNYVVAGEKKDLDNRGGERSAPRDREPDPRPSGGENIACVPVPDPNLGEKMCACVVLKKRTVKRWTSWSPF